MPINYAEQFADVLVQKYETELKSYALFQSNPGVGWLNAKTIKLPHITTTGYKDYARTAQGFGAGTLENQWEAKTLAHDRGVEFYIDTMDVEESGLTLAVANVTNVFEAEQAIPERDAYVFSKLYADYTAAGQTAGAETITAANALEIFDTYMSEMDDESVPMEGPPAA